VTERTDEQLLILLTESRDAAREAANRTLPLASLPGAIVALKNQVDRIDDSIGRAALGEVSAALKAATAALILASTERRSGRGRAMAFLLVLTLGIAAGGLLGTKVIPKTLLLTHPGCSLVGGRIAGTSNSACVIGM